MIITVTLNPAVDRTLWVSSLAPGNTNRVLRSVMDPGGKGINMSLVLRECGTETTALGFIAGHTGQFIKDLPGEPRHRDLFVEVKGETRINIAVDDLGRRPHDAPRVGARGWHGWPARVVRPDPAPPSTGQVHRLRREHPSRSAQRRLCHADPLLPGQWRARPSSMRTARPHGGSRCEPYLVSSIAPRQSACSEGRSALSRMPRPEPWS